MSHSVVYAQGEKVVGPGELGGLSGGEELSRAWKDNKQVLSSVSAEDWVAIEEGVEAALASPHEATAAGRAVMNLHLKQLQNAVPTLERLVNVPAEDPQVLEDLTAMLQAELARRGMKQE
jgi:hypothetical protein